MLGQEENEANPISQNSLEINALRDRVPGWIARFARSAKLIGERPAGRSRIGPAPTISHSRPEGLAITVILNFGDYPLDKRWSGLVSLWDIMIRIESEKLMGVQASLESAHYLLSVGVDLPRPSDIVSVVGPPRDQVSTEIFGIVERLAKAWEKIEEIAWDRLASGLTQLDELCSSLVLIHTKAHLERMQVYYEQRYREGLVKELPDLSVRLADELRLRFFLSVPPERAPYYGSTSLFGDAVACNFPAASTDIEEAGNCFALGRWTACVFHCMRILELGLRVLARELEIPEEDCKMAQWGELVGKIEGKIKDAERASRKSLLRQRAPLYAEAATNFGHFNAAWRRHVSHAHENYDDERAKRILSHVKEFMASLCALGLKES